MLVAYDNKHLFSNSQVGQLRFGLFGFNFAGPAWVKLGLAPGYRPVLLHMCYSGTCSHLYRAYTSGHAFLLTIAEAREEDPNHISTFKVCSHHISQDSIDPCKSMGEYTEFTLWQELQSHMAKAADV